MVSYPNFNFQEDIIQAVTFFVVAPFAAGRTVRGSRPNEGEVRGCEGARMKKRERTDWGRKKDAEELRAVALNGLIELFEGDKGLNGALVSMRYVSLLRFAVLSPIASFASLFICLHLAIYFY